jgi:hypothetical protein
MVTMGPGGFREAGGGTTFWLCGWLAAEIAVGNLVRRMPGHVDFHFPAILAAFPVVWLAIWTVVGYYVLARWLLAFWGYKQLTVNATTLVVRASLFGQARTQEIALADVQNVQRVGDANHSPEAGAIGRVTALRDTVAHAEMSPEARAEFERRLAPQIARVEQAERKAIWSVAFSARGKTYRFGQGLTPATCQTIEDAIERARGRVAKAAP